MWKGWLLYSLGTNQDPKRGIYDNRNILSKYNAISVFISQNITFIVVRHLEDRKAIILFEYFKEI